MVALVGEPETPIAFAHSVIGKKHTAAKKICQDACLCIKEREYILIAVADGHGGNSYFRSDLGSHFAVLAAHSCMADSAVIPALKASAHEKERERVIRQLKRSIVGRWNTLVTEHLDTNPFSDDELVGIPQHLAGRYRVGEQLETAYGSTLIAVLWTEFFLLALQIGDGSCVTVSDEGIFSQPVPSDEKCFLNMTTSLCDAEAAHEFRHHYSENIPVAVLIGSDGIDDCFAGEEKLFDFYRLILLSFSQKEEADAKAELIDYLPRLSEKGSGDDISIAMIYRKIASN